MSHAAKDSTRTEHANAAVIEQNKAAAANQEKNTAKNVMHNHDVPVGDRIAAAGKAAKAKIQEGVHGQKFEHEKNKAAHHPDNVDAAGNPHPAAMAGEHKHSALGQPIASGQALPANQQNNTFGTGVAPANQHLPADQAYTTQAGAPAGQQVGNYAAGPAEFAGAGHNINVQQQHQLAGKTCPVTGKQLPYAPEGIEQIPGHAAPGEAFPGQHPHDKKLHTWQQPMPDLGQDIPSATQEKLSGTHQQVPAETLQQNRAADARR